MVIKHGDELCNAAALVKSDFCEITGEPKKIEILKEVLSKYTNTSDYSYPLWECLVDSVSVYKEFAWECFKAILRDKEVIFFFENEDDERMFLFRDGGELTRVLEDCYKFTFYITNPNVNFLISYNDHNYLLLCGEAREWL